MKKRITVLLTSLFIIGVLSVSVTSAYLIAKDDEVNKVYMGKIDVTTPEDFEMTNDYTYTKNPRAKNNGNRAAYVRMKITFSDSEMKNKVSWLPLGTNWVDGGDGYYYYNIPLAPGGQTPPLFNRVVTEGQIPFENLPPFNLYVTTESIIVPLDGTAYKTAWQQALANA